MRRVVTDVLVAAGLFWLAGGQYRAATGVVQLCDSGYSLAVVEQFFRTKSVDLSGLIPADPTDRESLAWYDPNSDLPYQLVRVENPDDPFGPPRVYYGYPLGSSVLSAPFVRWYVGKGQSSIRDDGTLDPVAEGKLQVKIAARVAAATVAAIYVLVRFFCPPFAAGLVAVGFGFGSPVYSTLSRALWSHTWQVLLLSLAVVVLVAARRLRGRPFWWTELPLGVVLGTLLFWAVAVRPHAVVSAAAVGVYLLGWHRRLIPTTVVAGTAWAVGFVAVVHREFGTLTPPSVYAAGAVDGKDVFNRLFWLMASPSRGLLVYCPFLVVVGWLLIAYRRELIDRSLLVPAGLAVVGYVALFSAYEGWHAGSSYGPRYFSDVIPWFVLATAMAVGAMVRSSAVGVPWQKVVESIVLAAAFGWGVFVHHRGANAVETWEWNYLAAKLGQDGAVKDWSHPQFLAGLTYRVLPDGSVADP